MAYTTTCCSKKVDEEEYILNHGMCNTCMDKGGTVMAYRYLCGECIYEVEKPLTKGEIIRVQGSLRIVNSVDKRVIELGGIGAMQEAKYIGTLDQLEKCTPLDIAYEKVGWYVIFKENSFQVMQHSPFSEVLYAEQCDDMETSLRELQKYLALNRVKRVLVVAGVGTVDYKTQVIDIDSRWSPAEFRKRIEPITFHSKSED